MFTRRAILIFLPLILIPSVSLAANRHIQVAAEECGADTPMKAKVAKSGVFTDKTTGIRAYGTVLYRRMPSTKTEIQCRIVYKLYLAESGKPFTLVKQLEENADDGQSNGIDLIGLSPDNTKFAANFWIAQGDAQFQNPVVYDLSTKAASNLALEDKIQKLIHGCDQLEDFIGVTNTGEAAFAIPPSEYSEAPECGDKGIWHFNLKSGRVYRVAKISGDKWQ